MHCWKIINVERDFGTTRIIILSVLAFLLSFSFSYVLIGLERNVTYTDRYFMHFLVAAFFVYPLHKFIHYFSLIDFHSFIKLKLIRRYRFVWFIQLKIKKVVPKYRYIISLFAPFIFLNGLLLYCAIIFPAYGHYFTLLFGYHCLICLIDLLNIKSMILAPHHAVIEETPKGYEVLVPIDIKKR